MFHPQRMQPTERDRVLAACEAGASSVHGSGLNPGNLSGVLPLALSGMSRTIDKLKLHTTPDEVWELRQGSALLNLAQTIEQAGLADHAVLKLAPREKGGGARQ